MGMSMVMVLNEAGVGEERSYMLYASLLTHVSERTT